MNYLVKLWRQMFDIRAGEHVRTWAMFWYLFSVLMAYYIVKPVSRSMFLTKFDVDKLPSLYIVIAVAGGVRLSLQQTRRQDLVTHGGRCCSP